VDTLNGWLILVPNAFPKLALLAMQISPWPMMKSVFQMQLAVEQLVNASPVTAELTMTNAP
jgi:hypothetical protein